MRLAYSPSLGRAFVSRVSVALLFLSFLTLLLAIWSILALSLLLLSPFLPPVAFLSYHSLLSLRSFAQFRFLRFSRLFRFVFYRQPANIVNRQVANIDHNVARMAKLWLNGEGRVATAPPEPDNYTKVPQSWDISKNLTGAGQILAICRGGRGAALPKTPEC